ncbi:hypothetical protein [Micromonospora sp. L32]|uniref:hypothetical protein n=1 Tax=unclassified Micromonospora TaxID=2617518 RepID=UPI003F88B3DB
MELWDRDVAPRAERLDELPAPLLYQLATEVIERTIPVFEPRFEEFFPPSAVALVRRFLAECKDRLPDRRLLETEVDEYFSVQEELALVPTRLGVGPFLVALGRLVESSGERGIDGEQVLEILSACYESIVMSNISGRESIEKELANPLCMAEIKMQHELLGRYGL